MISNLLNILNSKKKIVVSIHLIICFIGLSYLLSVPFEYIPKNNYTAYEVKTIFIENSPELIDTLITAKIFEAISNEKFVQNVTAISERGNSSVRFEMKREYELEVSGIIREIKESFPQEVGSPSLNEIGESEFPFMKIIFYEPDSNLNQLKEELLQIPGILKISISGNTSTNMYRLDREKLDIASVRVDEIKNLVSMESEIKSAGRIFESHKEISLKGTGVKFGENFPFRIPINSFLSRTFAESDSHPLLEGRPITVMEIIISESFNPKKLSRIIRNNLKLYEAKYHSTFFIFYDRWESILRGISDFLVVLITSVTLGSCFLAYRFQSKPIMILFIITLISTYLYTSTLYLILQKKINLYTLIGISLGSGLIFDYGITILKSHTDFKSKNIWDIDLIFRSAFYSLLTTMIVFFPLFFLNSTICDMYYEISLSICITLFFGFINSFLLFPLYIWNISKVSNGKETELKYSINEKFLAIFLSKINSFKKLIKFSFNKFSPCRSWKLKVRFIYIVLFIYLLLYVISLFKLKIETYPRTLENEFILRVYFPNSDDTEKDQLFKNIDKQIRSLGFLISVLGTPNQQGGIWDIKVRKGYGDVYFSQILKAQLCDMCKTEISRMNPFISGFYEAGNLHTIMLPTDLNKDLSYKISDILKNTKNILYIQESQKVNISNLQYSREKLSFMNRKYRDSLRVYSNMLQFNQEKGERTVLELRGNPKYSHIKDFQSKPESDIEFPIHRRKGIKYNPLLIMANESDVQKILTQITSLSGITLNVAGINKEEIIWELLYSASLSLALLLVLLILLYESGRTVIMLGSCILFVFFSAYLFLFLLGHSLNSASFLGIIILSGMSVDPILLVLESTRDYRSDTRRQLQIACKSVEPIVHLNICTTLLSSLSVLIISGTDQFQSSIAVPMIGGILGLFLYFTYIFPYILKKIYKRYA